MNVTIPKPFLNYKTKSYFAVPSKIYNSVFTAKVINSFVTENEDEDKDFVTIFKSKKGLSSNTVEKAILKVLSEK